MNSDRQLTHRIAEALVRDLRVSGQRIVVSVSKGIVTLRGSVQSYRRKLAAQEIAASVPECREVVNQLRVQPPKPLADEEVARLVRAALDAHADITREAIVVSVAGGVVTLRGTIGNPWEQRLAEDMTLGVRGVRGVKNLLVVDFIDQVEAETLSREVLTAFSRTRGLHQTSLRVAVQGSLIVLSGEVPQFRQKLEAERLALRFPPLQVRNNILVRERPNGK